MCSNKSKGGIGLKSFSKLNKDGVGGLPMTEMRSGERLFAVNLVSS